MRILLYEWSCSGGLRGPSAAAVVGEDGILPGDGPFQVAAATVPVEGRAMLEALLADGVRRQGWKLAVLVDRSLSIDVPAGVQQIDVDGATEIEALVRAASSADCHSASRSPPLFSLLPLPPPSLRGGTR